MVDSSKPTVLITGISGFLGSHITLQYLQDGGYNVRGTVRDTKNEKKLEPLKKAFGDLYDKLELRAADLTDKASIMKAAEGVDYIVHTASPFVISVKDEERDLIRPAVDGTLAAMEAALQNKVKRIVITSSTVSVSNQKEKDKPKDFTWSEKHMSDSSKGPHIDGYSRSKTMAEEAAWKFKEENKHIHDIEVVTINPSLILGPAFVGAGFTSGDIIAQILLRKMPGVPKIKFGLVDVRDVARAHLQGLKVPEAANKRFILCKESLFFKEIGVILRKTWKHQGYNPLAKELPQAMFSVGGIFSHQMAWMDKQWGKPMTFDVTQSRQVLGIEYERPIAQTINEMVVSMLETGALEDRRPPPLENFK